MRVGGSTRSEREVAAADLAAQGANAPLLAESFKAVLQRHRRAGEPGREEPRQRSGDRISARAQTRPQHTGRDNPRADKDEQAQNVTPGEWAGEQSRMRLLLKSTDHGVPKPIAANELQDAPRFRRAGASGARSCIEVVHSRTGLRFMLSREGDVWLLAIESANAPRAAEMAALVATLNAHFAASGLGAVDVIVT
jgi:hypothetical protein